MQGPPGGADGAQGAPGARGLDAGYHYIYEADTESADSAGPDGPELDCGELRLVGSNYSTVTHIEISTRDRFDAFLGDEIATWDDASATVRGTVHIRKVADYAVQLIYRIVGDSVLLPTELDGCDRYLLAVEVVEAIDEEISLASGDQLVVNFTRAGDIGPQGPKLAIMPYGDQFLGLFCTESPNSLFEDYYRVQIREPRTACSVLPLDPRFVGVCEEGTLFIGGVAASRPAEIGARIVDDNLHVESRVCPVDVTVHVLGVRKGFRKLRFPVHDEATRKRNDDFWNTPFKPCPPNANSSCNTGDLRAM